MAIRTLEGRKVNYDPKNGSISRVDDDTVMVRLSDRQNEVLDLLTRENKQYTSAQISNELIGMPESYVRVVISKLRESIGKLGPDIDSKKILRSGYYVPVERIPLSVINDYYQASMDEDNLDHNPNADYNKVFNVYEAGTKQGYPRAANALGRMYLYGKGREQDMSMAFRYFLESAEMGYSSAQLNLAEMYLRGWGTETDNGKAVEWLTKAAENETPDGDAMYRLYMIYSKGRKGIPVDPKKAANWLYRANRMGVTDYANYMKDAAKKLKENQSPAEEKKE